MSLSQLLLITLKTRCIKEILTEPSQMCCQAVKSSSQAVANLSEAFTCYTNKLSRSYQQAEDKLSLANGHHQHLSGVFISHILFSLYTMIELALSRPDNDRTQVRYNWNNKIRNDPISCCKGLIPLVIMHYCRCK